MDLLKKQKLINSNLIFISSIILFSFLFKFLFMIFYAGHSDIYNALSFMEYFDNKQDTSGMPYSPFSYIFPYYSSYLLKYISIDYAISLRIFTFFSEILLFFSLRGLTLLDDKKLSLLIFLNPFLMLYSGIHGQIDLWAISFAFLSLRKNENFTEVFRALYLGISCLIKPVFLPIILFYIIKQKKINFEFLISFGIIFFIPYFAVNIGYMSIFNLYLILYKFTASGFMSIDFFYNFPSLIENILIILFICLLTLTKRKILIVVLFLPVLILIKSGFNTQYIAWLMPLFILNYRVGFLTSIFFSILYIFLIFNSFDNTGLLLNSSALSLNNSIFGNNFISQPISTELMKLFYKIFSITSPVLIAYNVYFFCRNHNEK